MFMDSFKLFSWLSAFMIHAGGFSGWMVGVQSPGPESGLCLGLGNISTLVLLVYTQFIKQSQNVIYKTDFD